MAFVAADSAGLLVVDVTHPDTPVLVATVEQASGARSVAISGNVPYVAEGSGGLQAYDITNPAVPQLVGSFTSGRDLTHVAAFGSAVVVSEAACVMLLLICFSPAPAPSTYWTRPIRLRCSEWTVLWLAWT